MMTPRGVLRAALWILTCTGGAVACRRFAFDSSEQLAAPSALALRVTVAPDTVALAGELTLTLTATNPLTVGVRAPGPCSLLPLRMQVVGADSVVRYALVGTGGGCKLPGGPTIVRLPPGWTETLASRGMASNLLGAGTQPGQYLLRGIYATPTDTAFGEWRSLWGTR